MDKVLVFGVDGALGSNLALAWAEKSEILGLSRRYAIGIEGCQTAACGGEAAELASWIHSARPLSVVHCGPWSTPAWDEIAADDDCSTNLSAVAAACEEVGAKLTVITSDAAFCGPRMFHEERSPQRGDDPRGAWARQAEQTAGPDALIVRTHAFGWSPVEHEAGFAERCWRSLSSGENCLVDADKHATPILATDLADLIWAAWERDLTGVYHMAGAERTSPFRFAAELAVAFGLPGRFVDLDPRSAARETRRYTEETSLHSHRAKKALDRPLPMLREGLARYAAQAEDGLRARMWAENMSHAAAA